MAKGNRGGQRGLSAYSKYTLTFGKEQIKTNEKLVYGEKDPNLTGKSSTVVEQWEKRRQKEQREWANAFDKDGKPLGEILGSYGEIDVPAEYDNQVGGVFTHIHPRESGSMGGTFSVDDMQNFTSGVGPTYRAVAKEGTYTITKSQTFDSKTFLSYIRMRYQANEADYFKAQDRIAQDVSDGKISYKQSFKAVDIAWNDMLIKNHNALISGQKMFGYYYALEKR